MPLQYTEYLTICYTAVTPTFQLCQCCAKAVNMMNINLLKFNMLSLSLTWAYGSKHHCTYKHSCRLLSCLRNHPLFTTWCTTFTLCHFEKCMSYIVPLKKTQSKEVSSVHTVQATILSANKIHTIQCITFCRKLHYETVLADIVSGILCVIGFLWDSCIMGVYFTCHHGTDTAKEFKSMGVGGKGIIHLLFIQKYAFLIIT